MRNLYISILVCLLAATSSAQEKGISAKRISFTIYFGSNSSGNTCSKSDTLLRVESSFEKDVLYQVYSVEMRLDDTFSKCLDLLFHRKCRIRLRH